MTESQRRSHAPPEEALSHSSASQNVDRRWAYAALRLAFGINMLVHGAVRLPKLSAFVEATAAAFRATPLPAAMVRGFAFVLSPLEASVGALLVIGYRTRFALLFGQLLMASLMFGTALREDWNTLGIQLTYSLAYFVLHYLRSYDTFSIDARAARSVEH